MSEATASPGRELVAFLSRGVTMAAHSLIFDDRKLMTVEEYLHSSFEPDAELVDGRIEERNVGEIPHSRWQYAIQVWFAMNPGWGLRALPEVRVQVTAQNFRVPDVTVLRKEQLDGRIVTAPPVAVFEVVSPDDRYPDVMKKLREYQAMAFRTSSSWIRRLKAFRSIARTCFSQHLPWKDL